MNNERFLIDSTIWVRYLRGNEAALKEKIVALVAADRACTSEVIMLEILRGARSEKDFKTLRHDFLALPQLPMTAEAWERAWGLAYALRKAGANVPLADTVIAALAIHHGCTLLHSDRHFGMIAEQSELKAIEAQKPEISN